jgi:hypothetical protein
MPNIHLHGKAGSHQKTLLYQNCFHQARKFAREQLHIGEHWSVCIDGIGPIIQTSFEWTADVT